MTDVFTWPVGRDADKRSSRTAPAAPIVAYLVGTIAGGVASATVINALGLLAGARESTAALVVVGVVTLAAVGLELAGRFRPLPERHAQVPRRWLRWRSRPLTALAFGAMIGAGVLTRLQHPVAYVLAAIVLVVPSLAIAAAIGAVYGGSRGLALATTWVVDSSAGRRIPWESLITYRRAVRRSLALVAAATSALFVMSTF